MPTIFQQICYAKRLMSARLLLLIAQIYDEYGREGLKAFELKEMAKQTVGPALKHPAEVRLISTWIERKK